VKQLGSTIGERKMTHGRWRDFTNKYGFEDGEALNDGDYQARDKIVQILNETLKNRGITAVVYDRPGLHNSCLILLLPNKNSEPPEALLERFLKEEDFNEVALPDDIANQAEEIVAKAYKQVAKSSAVNDRRHRRRVGRSRQ
jgi:hypothetical protein